MRLVFFDIAMVIMQLVSQLYKRSECHGEPLVNVKINQRSDTLLKK